MRSPFENTSHTIVRRLTYRSLKMNRKRNFFIAIAIKEIWMNIMARDGEEKSVNKILL